MLFRLAPNTPLFRIFELLNKEFLYFLEQTVTATEFGRVLFSAGAIGQAFWDNSKENDQRAQSNLTRDKFETLFTALHNSGLANKQRLFESMQDQQDFNVFFNNPNRDVLAFLTKNCFDCLKSVATHLYCATKDLQPIVQAAGGNDITSHFNAFRTQNVNGNICKACGMEKLATFRAGVPDGKQWRADYDHQLCKSKYPIFAVHPYNLIPLCTVCNQDAKKAKDLFRHGNGNDRLAFYPYREEARGFITIVFDNLRDPEPTIKVEWNALDATVLDKLNTWDEVYDIRRRVEGQFRSLEAIIEDEINPRDSEHLVNRIHDEARPVALDTLKRKEWAFWYQKLFSALEQIDLQPFVAKWNFVNHRAADSGDFILGVE